MQTHIEVTHRAHYYAKLFNSSVSDIISEYPQYVEAGSFFPDWGYFCGSEITDIAAETAHWAPFWSASIAYIHQKYPKPWSSDARKLIAFLMGIISHGVADVTWHSLYMDEGFIDASSYLNFNESYPKGHSAADVGGEWVLNRLGKNNYAQFLWHIPTADLINIYSRMGIPVKWSEINICMCIGWLGNYGGRLIGRWFFPATADAQPFFTEKYFDYHLGGVNSMAVLVADCWNIAGQLLTDYRFGTLPLCEHMKDKLIFTVSRPVSASLLSRVKNMSRPIIALIKQKLVHVKNTVTAKAAQANDLRDTARQFLGFVFKLIKGGLSTSCGKFDYNATIVSKIDYALLGKSIVKGDFNGNGLQSFVFGAPGYSTNGFAQNGAVFVLDKAVNGTVFIEDISLQINGPREHGVHFGQSMAVVDLNKDGIDDLAISAPYSGYKDNLIDGKVYVIFGRKGLGLRSDRFDLIIDGIIRHPPSKFPNQYDDVHHVLGEKLYSFDLNGDGYRDLIIGSPSASVISGDHQKGILQAFLASKDLVGTIKSEKADWKLSGSQNYEWFGYSFAVLDNILLIGAPGYRNSPASKTNGRVFGFQITPNETLAPELKFIIVSDIEQGQFGSFILVDDFYLSGSKHVLISSPTELSPRAIPRMANLLGMSWNRFGYQAGKIRVIDVKDFTGRIVLENGKVPNQNFEDLNGGSSFGHLGESIASMPDKRGIFVTEKYADGERGRLYKYTLGTRFGMDDVCLEGPNYHEQFASQILLGDLNGNGNPDLLIASENALETDWSRGVTNGMVRIRYDIY